MNTCVTRFGLLVLAWCLTWATSALAQATPALRPPIVQGSTEVPYPPGAEGDASVVLTPALSGLPYFFVRGAPPNNNGDFLDGVRVPLLFHVALGPGVIHPGLLERVDFYPGAAPVSFGGFARAPSSPDRRGRPRRRRTRKRACDW